MLYERIAISKRPESIIAIELLELDKNGIHVAYITELPQKDIFENKLKQAIAIARENHAKKLMRI